jgi:hypothetical protein
MTTSAHAVVSAAAIDELRRVLGSRANDSEIVRDHHSRGEQPRSNRPAV